METKDFITEKMDEKIYSANSGDSKENITEILYYFLDELVKRKRKQSNIGGLSAGLVSSKDEFAAKVRISDIAKEHGRTYGAIESRLDHLGLKKKPFWLFRKKN